MPFERFNKPLLIMPSAVTQRRHPPLTPKCESLSFASMSSRTKPDQPAAKQERPPVIPARELFGSASEVTINYLGTLYRLRITRNDKLILTK